MLLQPEASARDSTELVPSLTLRATTGRKVALVAECWSKASRPLVSGVMSAGLNLGILFRYTIVVSIGQALADHTGFVALAVLSGRHLPC